MFIGLTALFLLFPFVYKEIPLLFGSEKDVVILILGSLVMFAAALFDFEALRKGKFCIIEPLYGIEVPVSIGLSIGLWGESLSTLQMILIGVLFLGIVLAVTTHHTHLHYHKRIFERGVVLALIGAIGMGLGNFLVGVSSQTTSPLLSIWFIHGLLSILCLCYLLLRKQLGGTLKEIKNNFGIIAGQSILDNVAWICFAFATTMIPISIATGITESYIALGALLGVLINKEKIRWHQYVGVAITCIAVVILAIVSE
jgi:drug/metabolite transporter (DMT)-like permease